MTCPACSSNKNSIRQGLGCQILECGKCGAVHGTAYLGESYTIVSPWFAPASDRSMEEGRARYFDITTLGSEGIGRRHGWFNPETRLITQVG